MPPLFLFSFGKDKNDDDDTAAILDKKMNGYELARYDTGLAGKDYDSLFEYIQLWAKEYFTAGTSSPAGESKKLLATPVKIIPTDEVVFSNAGDNDNSNAVVASSKSIKIVFQKTDTGFKSKKDEQNDDDNKERNNEKKKKAPPKQGGVEIVVEKLKKDEKNAEGGVCIRAVRCEMDEDTMIKEMSEETILQQLQKAIKVWKKDHAAAAAAASSS
jgi:hypothetical protein